MAKTISPEVLEVLKHVEIDGQHVKLTGTLDRKLYTGVAEVLKILGGKWTGGKVQTTVFPPDKNPQELIDALLAGGNKIEKNPLAYFPTPAPVIAAMLEHLDDFDPFPLCRVLEPSAGEGAIAKAVLDLIPHCTHPDQLLDCVEFDPGRAKQLRSQGLTVYEADFLTLPVPDTLYDVVLMNPPFTIDNKTNAFALHILHAWSFLKPGGRLISVIPSVAGNAKFATFFAFVQQHGSVTKLPEKSFKTSGTNLNCSIIALTKPHAVPVVPEPPALEVTPAVKAKATRQLGLF
ncbi:MAG: methyltransferase [Stenomitos frigidus ULC029]